MPEGPAAPRARIVAVGNAKGGSGKSTTAMHIVGRLMALGHRVGLLDLDWRQQTCGRYLAHRAALCARRGIALPMPTYEVVAPAGMTRAPWPVGAAGAAPEPEPEAEADDGEDDGAGARARRRQTTAAFEAALSALAAAHEVVVIDCPGSDTHLARLGHGAADVLLTPLNDSFVDLDVLATMRAPDQAMVAPGWYSELVFAQRKQRLLATGTRLDWVVMRNRVAPTKARHKKQVADALTGLAPRLGFREIGGLGERVIYRELFLRGLTLCDLRGHDTGVRLTMSHVAAHQEIRDMVSGLGLLGAAAARVA